VNITLIHDISRYICVEIFFIQWRWWRFKGRRWRWCIYAFTRDKRPKRKKIKIN